MTPEQWNQLLTEFGNIAGQVYQAAAKQAAFEAWASFALTAFLLGVGAVLFVVFIKDIRGKGNWAGGLAIALLFWLTLAILTFMFTIPLFVTFWINPEWAILKTLASLVR